MMDHLSVVATEKDVCEGGKAIVLKWYLSKKTGDIRNGGYRCWADESLLTEVGWRRKVGKGGEEP